MLTTIQKNKVRSELHANRYDVFLFSYEEMDKLVRAMKKNNTSKTKLDAWERLKEYAHFGANYYSAGKDVLLLNTLLADFGYIGAKAYIKFYKDVPHIILKGNPRLRKIFTGTRYRLDNAKVVKMGLGKLGAIEDVKGGGILTIILVTGYRVLDYFQRDNATLTQLFGSLSTDIVKIGISTGASISAAAWVAAAGATATESSIALVAMAGGAVVAVGPLIAVIVIGVGVAYGLDLLDDHFHITEHVIAALDELSEKGVSGIIAEEKESLMRTATKMTNAATDTMIDYIVEEAEHVAVQFLRNLSYRFSLPTI